MSQPNQDLLNQFNEILKRLSTEDKQKLYDRLKVMSPEDRNKTIVTIVERYGNKKAPAPKSPEAPRKVEQAKRPEPKPANTTSVEEIRKEVESAPKATQRVVDYEEEIPSRPKPKKRLKKPVKIAFTLFAVGLLLVIIAIATFINKDKLGAIFGDNGNAVASSDISESESAAVDETSPEVTDETIASETTIAEPTEIPGPTNVPVVPGSPDLTGLVIVLDPGHQAVADNEAEVCAPWLDISKPRCTAGATGSVTGVCEYDLTLQYCLIIQNYLEQCGATVILTRDSNDVNMSNQERAQFALDNNADVFIRVHCDNANEPDATGVRVYVPDTGDFAETSVELGNQLGNAVAAAEGLTFDETHSTYLYTGLNYANTIPAFQISLGYLSNSENEAVLLDPDNEIEVAVAFADFCAMFL